MGIMITYHGYNTMYNAHETWAHVIHGKVRYVAALSRLLAGGGNCRWQIDTAGGNHLWSREFKR